MTCANLLNMPAETASTIRDQRIRQGLTLSELAAKCTAAGAPLSESHLSRIERGAVPRPRLRATLARLLDLDISDFERQAS